MTCVHLNNLYKLVARLCGEAYLSQGSFKLRLCLIIGLPQYGVTSTHTVCPIGKMTHEWESCAGTGSAYKGPCLELRYFWARKQKEFGNKVWETWAQSLNLEGTEKEFEACFCHLEAILIGFRDTQYDFLWTLRNFGGRVFWKSSRCPEFLMDFKNHHQLLDFSLPELLGFPFFRLPNRETGPCPNFKSNLLHEMKTSSELGTE